MAPSLTLGIYMIKFFTNATANTTGLTEAIETQALTGPVPYAIHAFGTFDGATISIYFSLNGADADDGVIDSSLVFTSKGFKTILLPAGVTIWAAITNAGASTDVTCWLAGQGLDS